MRTKEKAANFKPLGSIQAARTVVVAQFERKFVTGLLRSLNGNVSAAAREAGVTRQNFQRLMKKHKIKAENFRIKK